MMVVENEFNLRQVVYLKTDNDQLARMVVGIIIYDGCIMYDVTCGTTATSHYGFEISAEKNVLMGVLN